jgi:hypothetical protein
MLLFYPRTQKGLTRQGEEEERSGVVEGEDQSCEHRAFAPSTMLLNARCDGLSEAGTDANAGR